MACLLQPECKFPVEVVDVEVKITSMQGMHIFRRDRMTQLIKCTPWSMRLHLHSTIIKKMKTFLEVENKMGLIPVPVPGNQFRPSPPETNLNIRKNDTTEKRKRATPKKKFRPGTPKITATCPPLPEAPPKPKNNAPSVPVREDTPWTGAGKMSGKLFKDGNWLLPKNYLVTENKKEDMTSVASTRPPLKEEPKTEEQAISLKAEKCSWGPHCPFCKSQKKVEENMQQQKPSPNVLMPQAKRPDTLNLNMTKTKQQWEAEMERLNSKYNLDCFSDSELDSESDEGEQYQYEHGYKTLI